MPLFDWIRSDLHSLNLDWIISKIKTVEESEQGAVDAAADANASKSAAAASATAANNSKNAAAGSATLAAVSAQQAQNLVDQLDTTIAQDVTDWLDEHITPTTPAVDDTLTVSGAAADAAVTGDKITELKTALTDIGVTGGTAEVPLTVTWGEYIDRDGSVVSTSGNYGACRGSVVAGRTYRITASSNFYKPYYAWYDSNMNLVQIGSLSTAGSAVTSITNEEATAPTGAAYIVAVQNTSGSTAEVSKETYSFPALEDLESDVETLSEDVNALITESIESVSLTNEYGYYINTNGVITSTSGNYGIKRGNVTAGKKYYVTASSNWSNPFYAWYDASDNLIQIGQASSIGSAYTSITDSEVIAPTGAEKIVINWNMASVEATLKIEDIKLAGKWDGKKWACVGNSLTDDNQYTTKHYFDYVSEATGIEPINMGDSGTGYKRGEDTDRAFYQRILNIDTSADVVTIFGSFNDIGAGYTLGTYTDTGTTTIAGCINTAIDNLQSVMPTAVLGIVAPTPWATARPDFHTNADNYVNMLQKIAEHRSIPFLDLYRCSNLRPWDADFRALCYSNDGGNGVHPNELGHQIIAPKFNAFLESLIM